MRRAARVDANQSAIVGALRDVGATVTSTAAIGQGFPDLAVGFRGETFLLEIKDPAQPPSGRQLTTDERRWHEGWQGQAAIVETIEDALRVIGAL